MKGWIWGLAAILMMAAVGQGAHAQILSRDLEALIQAAPDGGCVVLTEDVVLDAPVAVDRYVTVMSAGGVTVTAVNPAGSGFILGEGATLLALDMVDARENAQDALIRFAADAAVLLCTLTGSGSGTAFEIIDSPGFLNFSIAECTVRDFGQAADIMGSPSGDITGNDVSGGYRVRQNADVFFYENQFDPDSDDGISILAAESPVADNYKDIALLSMDNGHCLVRSEPLHATARGGTLLVDQHDPDATLAGALAAAGESTVDTLAIEVRSDLTLASDVEISTDAALRVLAGKTVTVEGALSVADRAQIALGIFVASGESARLTVEGVKLIGGGDALLSVGDGARLTLMAGAQGGLDAAVGGGTVTLNEGLRIAGDRVVVESGGTLRLDGALTVGNGASVAVMAGGALNVGEHGFIGGDGDIVIDGVLTGDVDHVASGVRFKIDVQGDVTASGLVEGYAPKGTLVTLTANAPDFSGWTYTGDVTLEEGGTEADSTISFYPAGACAFTANTAPGSGPGTEPEPLAPTVTPDAPAFTVTPSTLALKVGETGLLTASEAGVTWTTSDAAVAKVEGGGLVTAVAKGTAAITAKAADGRTATCAVTVTGDGGPTDPTDPEDPEEFDIGIEVLAVGKGKVLILPQFKGCAGTWSVDNESVAKLVKEGKRVKAVGLGTAKLTYKVAGVPKKALVLNDRKLKMGDTYEIQLNVRRKGELVAKVTLDKKKLTLDTVGANSAARLTETLKPAAALDKEVFWTSGNPRVATVDAQGNVTAVGPGKCKVTAVSASLKRASVSVTVKGAVALSPAKKTLKVGRELTLTATLNEALADKTLVWTSNKPGVATVENGVVTALAKGKATITATASNGDTATCAITVKK